MTSMFLHRTVYFARILTKSFFLIVVAPFLGYSAFAGDIIRIPGLIKERSIEFSSSLKLIPEQALIRNVDTNAVSTTSPEYEVQTSTGVNLVLQNPAKLSAITTPIPLEAELKFNAKDKVEVIKLVPDSTAAWKRLTTWRDLKLQPALVTKTSEVSSALEKAVTGTLTGKVKDQKKTVLENYDQFIFAIANNIISSTDQDTKKQLAAILEGSRSEKLAWEKCGNIPVSQEAIKAWTPAPGNNQEPNPRTEAPKNLSPRVEQSSSASKSRGVRFQGYESMQLSRSPVKYKQVYNAARACVGIFDGDTGAASHASGFVIGPSLVLTCAHTVTRPDRLGNENPSSISIRIGEDSPIDNDTPIQEFKANVYFKGQIDGPSTEPYDYTLLQVNGLKEYVQAKRITPIALASFDVKAGTEFYVMGHPNGEKKKLTNNGVITYPHLLSVTKGPDDPLSEYEIVRAEEDGKGFLQAFQDLYIKIATPINLAGKLVDKYQYRYAPALLPGIGALCGTCPGYSGAGAILKDAKDYLDPLAFGVVVEGMPVDPLRAYKPSIKAHQILCPTSAIVRQVQTHRTTAWKDHKVTIIDLALDDDGQEIYVVREIQ